jgi:nicotinamidase-related amidase
MSGVVSLLDFKRVQAAPTLVLVDLHVGAFGVKQGTVDATVLGNCRSILAAARRRGMPVAFVRQLPPGGPWPVRRHPDWFADLAPTRADMVFDRSAPSCYASSEFAGMADHSPGQFVLAGLCGETSCLSTIVDGYHRGHRFTWLSDASASGGLSESDALEMHRSVTHVLAAYAEVTLTRRWLSAAGQTLGAL